MTFTFLKKTAVAFMTALICSSAWLPASAFADDLDDTRDRIAEVQAKIDEIAGPLEAAQDEYNAAIDAKEAAQKAQADIDARINELEASVAGNRKSLGERAVWIYKNGNSSANLLEALLAEDTLSGIVECLGYLDSMNRNDMAVLTAIRDEETLLEQQKEAYKVEETRAEEAEAVAKEIKDSVQPQMDELESILNGLKQEERDILGYQTGVHYSDVSSIPPNGSVVDYAMSRIGCPYVWGAAGPDSFDCSGLVTWAYAQVGIYLPHQSESQYAAADEILPLSQAMPGDVLYRPGHVGICTAPGATSYVHAPTFGAYVRDTDSLSWSGFTCALRFS